MTLRAASFQTKRNLLRITDIGLDQPAFLQIVFIDADCEFRQLAAILKQPLDIFANEV